MTQFVYYAGVDLGNTTIRFEDGLANVSQAGDGSIAVAGVKIDDPTGALTFTEWQPFIVDETACTPRRMFTGYLTNKRTSRGPYNLAAGRIYEFDLVDLNGLVHVQLLRGATAKRPRETGNARLAWLMGSVGLSGIVYDNGFVGSIVDYFDEADYTNRYPDEVLNDLCVSSVSEVGRIFFVYWDHATSRASLFLDIPTAAVKDSTLRISNVRADVDDAVTFAPSENSELTAAAEDIYCGVAFTTRLGTIYAHNSTTHATYFGNGFHRESSFETDRIGSADTANRHAIGYLGNHAGAVNTIAVTVRLPASKVNLIEAGQRVSVKFSHLAGYTSFTWTRVSRRTITLTPGTNDSYDVALELSVKGLNGAPAGNPGNFPHVPTTPSIVQQVSGASTIVMPGAITAGNTLVLSITNLAPGGGFFDYTAQGYTLGPLAVAGGGRGTVYKIAGSSESQTLGMGANVRGTWYEIPGTWVPGTYDANSAVTATGNGIVMTGGPHTVAASSIVFAIGDIGTGGAFNSALPLSFTPGSGMTEDADMGTITPNLWTGHAFPAAGSWTSQTTNSANVPSPNTPGYLYAEDVPWTMHSVEFVGTTSSGNPAAGTWVYDEVPTPVADGTTTTFTLRYTFADGSLLVKVDRLDQTLAVTSYDGVAKTFTLGFAPKAGEKIEVTYQGR